MTSRKQTFYKILPILTTAIAFLILSILFAVFYKPLKSSGNLLLFTLFSLMFVGLIYLLTTLFLIRKDTRRIFDILECYDDLDDQLEALYLLVRTEKYKELDRKKKEDLIFALEEWWETVYEVEVRNR
ncbi:MAG: hypothetical protein IJY62_02285 [Clostridia bacterium]|nr:hypothetical protein [Clostridia bacterium]